ncbi:unnamed protein product [Cyprideis torosa]|uniref:protein-serine/threonine phosphatase n=1 Tax=Cyprideis torosa TaxID=163714 RepID=A0A7R8W310_9CRUS|nr:unnamed protein product [Cyprideis torosa]CAG0881622.1 unnamed protein product [Cyprideis torosa]
MEVALKPTQDLSTLTKDVLKQAEDVKVEANAAFKDGNFLLASELYTKSIHINPYNAVVYANRSLVNLKLENFGYALTDASKAIELDSKYVKGYYRRAAAYMALGKFKLALKDFDTVVRVVPRDKDAKTKQRECDKIVKRMAFEKAIAVDTTEKPMSDSIAEKLPSIIVEPDYTGPHLSETEGVTVSFVEKLLELYKNEGKLHRKYAYTILLAVKKWFAAQPTLVEVSIPEDSKFTVCGDIHGQFYDLLHIFELNGNPSETNPFLFNGDFVDRGSFSVECIFTLFSYKLLYPNHFFMSRGNHESEMMNRMYGFEGEVRSKYSQDMVKVFTEVYNLLPLCHLLNKRVLVMHGGLSSNDDVTLQDILTIDRNRQPPEDGLMAELLWSDPMPQPGRAPSKRGVGCMFGPDVTQAFCVRNNLDYIIRSHEVKEEGYEKGHNGKCITVFSAPNYCDQMGNKGAFVTMTGRNMEPNFITYEASVSQ